DRPRQIAFFNFVERSSEAIKRRSCGLHLHANLATCQVCTNGELPRPVVHTKPFVTRCRRIARVPGSREPTSSYGPSGSLRKESWRSNSCVNSTGWCPKDSAPCTATSPVPQPVQGSP